MRRLLLQFRDFSVALLLYYKQTTYWYTFQRASRPVKEGVSPEKGMADCSYFNWRKHLPLFHLYRSIYKSMSENESTQISNNVNPVLQALLIADSVYVDKNTGKHIIVGVFRHIGIQSPRVTDNEDGSKSQTFSLPFAGSPFAYISMTDLRGEKKFSLRFVCLKNNEIIFDSSFNIECDDPLKVVEFAAPLPPLSPKQEGMHVLELLCNDALLGEFRINVVMLNQP